MKRISKQRKPRQTIFEKGKPPPPGAGRPKGSLNKMSRDLKECIMNAAEMIGRDGEGKDGATGYLATIAVEKPAVFCRLLERVLPLTIAGDAQRPIKHEHYESSDDVARALRDRGLPQNVMPMILDLRANES